MKAPCVIIVMLLLCTGCQAPEETTVTKPCVSTTPSTSRARIKADRERVGKQRDAKNLTPAQMNRLDTEYFTLIQMEDKAVAEELKGN